MINYQEVVEKQRQFFQSGKTLDVEYRIQSLLQLKRAILQHEFQIIEALKKDLNRSDFDSYTLEIGFVLSEITHILKSLRSWAKPRRVKTPITHIGSRSYLISEPYGVALIIAPWNYPVNLSIAPLIGAIAAGNTVILKPSELTPNTSLLLAKLINESFPPEYIHAVEGGPEVSTGLLQQKVDYIFFTGGTQIGKIVMEAAAKHLTPLTLELGGKSPCIIHRDADLRLTAKRLVWGKYLNAGQTCIAPDYLLVHKEIKGALISEIKHFIAEFYGEEKIKKEEYIAIVNDRHFKRLTSYLNQGNILLGGTYNEAKRIIEPTLMDQVSWEDPIMNEEIFGPILPILEYEQIEDALQMIQHHPKPLALYLFTRSKNIEDQVIQSVSFGGGCINDTIYHIATPYLPFGGVGSSGMGGYHGKASFDVFSHQKGVLKQTNLFDLPFRYPTMKNGLKWIKFFLK